MTIQPVKQLSKRDAKFSLLALILFSCLTLSLATGILFADESGYHPDVGDDVMIVKGGEERSVLSFGPTGLTGWFYEKEFIINGLDKGSPADGILKLGDRVRAVNGRRFGAVEFEDGAKGPRRVKSNRLRVMGDGITEAEAGNGNLKLTVWRGGKEVDLTVKLPKLGAYAPLWPYNCKKSATILKNACQWLVDVQKPGGAFMESRGDGSALGEALEGMLLLSSGDPKFLESARRLAYDFVKHPGPDPLKGEPQGTEGWGQSYQGMFVAEYYLLTGDSYVVPYLTWMRKVFDTGMGACGGWGHDYGHIGGYAVGGYINPVGVMVLNGLALMDEAGIKGDPKKLELVSNYFRRWSYGSRGIHYGDHYNPFETKAGASGTGKNVVAAMAFEVLGEPDTAKRFTLTVIDSYRYRDQCHSGPFFPLIWGPIGASRCTEAEYKMYMDYWTWLSDLSRRWNGSFMLPEAGTYTSRGPFFTMGGQALVYALPLKKTRACGATESPFAVKNMPAELKPVKALVDKKDYAAASKTVAELIKGGALNEVAKKRVLLMQESLATTFESVEYTIAAIKENLEKGESLLARTRLENLENLIGQDRRLAELKKVADEPRHDKICKAWQTYQDNKYRSFVQDDGFKVMKKLANDKSAGFVQGKAQRHLEEIKQWPTYEATLGTEGIFNSIEAAWYKNQKDPVLLPIMRYLAFCHGCTWTTYMPREWLKNGYKGDPGGLLGEFPGSTVLSPTSANGPAEWTYITMEAPDFPAGWQKADFNDKEWQKGNAPFVAPDTRKKTAGQFDKKHMLMRHTFEVKGTDFDSLRIAGNFKNDTDIYLNGVHIARIVGNNRGIDFAITATGLRALKKGRNILAAQATQGREVYVDVGLLGVKKAR